MKRVYVLLLAVVLLVGVVVAHEEDKEHVEVSVKTMPPSVVKTVPQAGDTEVDPALGEIRVTFSKDMITEKMWSWVQISKETFPKMAGDVHYLDDKRTCVLPVKLEPGKAYVIWFNKGKYNAFRDTNNNPSAPYQLVFETKKK